MTLAPATIGLSEADDVAVADHQHLVEDDLRADVRRYLFDLEFFAGGNLVLLAAGSYDRVHRNSKRAIAKKDRYFKALRRDMSKRVCAPAEGSRGIG